MQGCGRSAEGSVEGRGRFEIAEEYEQQLRAE